MDKDDNYRGPESIGYAVFPRRGRAYHATFEGRKIEISVSEKGRNMRIFVDGTEWEEANNG